MTLIGCTMIFEQTGPKQVVRDVAPLSKRVSRARWAGHWRQNARAEFGIGRGIDDRLARRMRSAASYGSNHPLAMAASVACCILRT